MDFDGNELSLSYYEGTSLATLRESRAAQPVLEEALRVQGSGHLKAQSIVRIALATTYVQQSEIEEACRLAGKALETHPSSASAPSRSGSPTSVPNWHPGEPPPQSRTSTSSSPSCG
jgi:hypothetical protein